MRIAIFTESLPPNTDGVVKTLCRLADTLYDENIEFKFFSPVKPDPDPKYRWLDKVKKVSSLPLFLYKDYKLGLPYFDGIEFDLETLNADLVHICTPSFLGVFGMNYAKTHNIPVVSSYHTNFVSYFPYFGISGLEKYGWEYLRWFHNRCERSYVPSPSTIAELEVKGIKNLELWQRGIETERFSPTFRSNELRASVGAENKPIILFVGRLINHKDLDDLVDAHNMLKKNYDYKIVIVGDGPMREELEGKMPEAHYTGYQYGEDLSRWYASADIFAFPSTTETFGNVILESFASGVPAVGVAKGGVGDIINHEQDGLIARPNDPVDFAAQLEKLLKDPQYAKTLGSQARVTAGTYSWSAINGRLLASYQEVIDNYHAKRYNYELAS